MAAPRRVRVMISSRNRDPIPSKGKKQTLSEARRELKSALESEELFGEQLFDVWINEDAPPAEGTKDAWEHCLAQVRRADLVLVLYNGNAGWTKSEGEIGICHAELMAAAETAPAKLRVIRLEPLVDGDSRSRDNRFREYVERQSWFHATATNAEELLDRCKATLREAVADMVVLGGREARKGKYYTGAALDWSRLDFLGRKQALEETLVSALGERGGEELSQRAAVVPVDGQSLLFVCHGVPAAMSVAAARELVGQPHLKDHELAGELEETPGPIHIIACHKNVTERQAMTLLGFPDATLVTPPFGIYVADNAQKVQLLLIKNCRDETATRHGLQRAFEWLEQSREIELLVARARARRRIVQVIAEEAS